MTPQPPQTTLTQHPLLPWAWWFLLAPIVLAVPVALLVRLIGTADGITSVLFLGTFLGLFGAYQYKRPVRFTLRPDSVHIEGGVLERAGLGEVTLQRAGLDYRIDRGMNMRHLQVWNLVLTSGGQEVVILALSDDRSEIEQVAAHLLSEAGQIERYKERFGVEPELLEGVPVPREW